MNKGFLEQNNKDWLLLIILVSGIIVAELFKNFL